MYLNRRRFCLSATAATLVSACVRRSFAAVSGLDVDAFERARVLREANGYLSAEPVTITAAHSKRSQGGIHDYFTEAEEWWPDPNAAGGPYVRQAGFANPDVFIAHREAMLRLSLIVPALTAAWKLTGQRRYAERAAAHLRAWFVAPATRMNPSLEYADAVFGVSKGRGAGILDTLQLVEPARAAGLLLNSDVFSLEEHLTLRGWFSDYLRWLTTSDCGAAEREAKDHHGSSWLLQVAEFAHLTGNRQWSTYCRERFRTKLIPDQVAADGRLPLELENARPYGYTLFAMDLLCTLAQTLSTSGDNLFTFALADGRGLRKVVATMAPFIRDKNIWPYSYDRQYFSDLPVRQPGLLFAGLAYSEPEYLSLWKTLEPEPKVAAVLRMYPARQPVLWV